MPQVRIGQFPGAGVQQIEVPAGTTVAAAIAQAGMNPQGWEVRHQGKQLAAGDMGTIAVTEGDNIVLTRRISGNLFRQVFGRVRRAYWLHIVVK